MNQAAKMNADMNAEMNQAVEPNPEVEAAPLGVPRPPAAVKWIIAAFFCIATIVQFIVLIDFGPDEPFHLQSAYDIAQGCLPQLKEASVEPNHIAQHPPLYYAMMAICWKVSGATQEPLSVIRGIASFDKFEPRAIMARRLMRCMSALLGCLTLWFIARTLALLRIPPPWQVYLIMWAAAWPMLQYVSGVVNNEMLAYAYSAWLCFLIVARWYEGSCSTRQALGLGLLCGASTLVKQNTLFAMPLALWVIWVTSARRLPNFGAFFGGVLLSGIWWPLHNILVGGTIFTPATRHPHQPNLAIIIQDWKGIFIGWSRALLESAFLPDWSLMFVPRAFETVVMVLGVMAIYGLWLAGLAPHHNKKLKQLRAICLVGLTLQFAMILYYAAFQDQRAQFGGRYLLNALPWAIVFLGASVPVPFWARRKDASGVQIIKPPGMVSSILLGFLIMIDCAWWFIAWTHFQTQVGAELQRRLGG